MQNTKDSFISCLVFINHLRSSHIIVKIMFSTYFPLTDHQNERAYALLRSHAIVGIR